MLNFLNELFGRNKPQKPQNTEGGKKTTPPKPSEGLKPSEGYKPQRTKPLPESTTWQIGGTTIPVEIHREYRRTWRYAFAKGGKLIVRLPIMPKANEVIVVANMQKILLATTVKKPTLLDFFETKTYKDGDTLYVNKQTYSLRILLEDRKTHSSKLLQNGLIEFKLAAADTEGGLQKAISTLLSRTIANHSAPLFTRRVHELNHQFFKKSIKSVNFKYNHSNWGSCSSSGNLNFSSRLLFAPDDVQDYVIIHELAHLVELNHSDRFWKLVADAMPNYAEKEKWLKTNSNACRF